MIDLSDLADEISALHLAAPPLQDIVRRASKAKRQRTQRRLTATVGVLALAIAATVFFVGRPVKAHPVPGISMYAGSASAAFVTKSGVVFVADQGNDSLLELNPKSKPPFDPVGTIPLPFTPGVVAISPDASTAYVAPLVPEFAGGSNALYEINLATGRVVRKIVDNLQPLGSITIGPDGNTGYAWGDDVVPIELSSGEIRAPIAHSTGEYTDFEIAPDGTTALALSDGPSPGFQVIDLTKGTLTRAVSTARLRVDALSGFWSPEATSYAPNGATAYVVVEQQTRGGSNVGLLKVSTRTGSIYSAVRLGGGEAGNLVVAPNGERAFVSIQIDVAHVPSGSFDVVPVDLVTMKPAPRIDVGDVQELGLLEIPEYQTLYAVDTSWRVTEVDETTGDIIGSSVIPVPSLLAPTLQPIAFVG
jgi:hypothetical protein